MDDDYLEPAVASTRTVPGTGSEKRKAANQLPQPLLVYDFEKQEVVGALVACQCLAVGGEAHVTFVHGGLHLLGRPAPLSKTDFAFQSVVFRLQPKVEKTSGSLWLAGEVLEYLSHRVCESEVEGDAFFIQ